MKVVTTPMCEEILILAGIKDYVVNKYPDEEDGDFAILLSESEVNMDSLKIKLNTFFQIEESVLKTVKILNSEIKRSELEKNVLKISEASPWANSPEKEMLKKNNRKIKVKVYSHFLKDIINDMGFSMVDECSDFIVFPDYAEKQIIEEIQSQNQEKSENISKNHNTKKILNSKEKLKYIKVPSHGDVPINPLERAAMRYALLEEELCTKP